MDINYIHIHVYIYIFTCIGHDTFAQLALLGSLATHRRRKNIGSVLVMAVPGAGLVSVVSTTGES